MTPGCRCVGVTGLRCRGSTEKPAVELSVQRWREREMPTPPCRGSVTDDPCPVPAAPARRPFYLPDATTTTLASKARDTVVESQQHRSTVPCTTRRLVGAINCSVNAVDTNPCRFKSLLHHLNHIYFRRCIHLILEYRSHL